MIPGLVVEVVSLFNDFGSAVEFLAGGHPIGEPLGDFDIAPTTLVGDQAPDPTDARAGKEHPLAIAGLPLQVVQHRVQLRRGQPLRLGHLLASVSERQSSAAAAALIGSELSDTRIAAAVCWSGWFGDYFPSICLRSDSTRASAARKACKAVAISSRVRLPSFLNTLSRSAFTCLIWGGFFLKSMTNTFPLLS